MLDLLKQYWLLLLIALTFILLFLAHRFPAVTERLYSMGIYKILRETHGRVFNSLPFAIFPLFYIFMLFVIFLQIFTVNYTNYSNLFLSFIFAFALGYWFNYARKTFASATGLEIREASEEELVGLCRELVGKINDIAPLVNRNRSRQTVLATKNRHALSKQTHAAFMNLSHKYPNLGLGGFTPIVKPMSRLMLYRGRVGVYTPLTMEVFVDFGKFCSCIPFAMAHEIAHFKGYAREDEAEFIAFLACMESTEPDFIYSGLMGALGYVHDKLHKLNPDEYIRVMVVLCKEAWNDWEHWECITGRSITSNSSGENANKSKSYLKRFRRRAIKIFDNISHIILKINRQSDGIKSYGRAFDLLIADYRKRNTYTSAKMIDMWVNV